MNGLERRVTNITYITARELTEKCNSLVNELVTKHKMKIQKLNSIQEVFPLLSDPCFTTDFLAIDLEYLYDVQGAEMFDIIHTVKTLIACTVYRPGPGKPIKRDIKIIGAVGGGTDARLIKEAAKLVDGFAIRSCPEFTADEVQQDVLKFTAGDLSMPKRVQAMLKTQKDKVKDSNKIDLTPRQTQIFELVSERAASNKTIAKILNISESTVKLHMTALLKKFGCRNRTQLAVFSQKQKVH